MMPDCGSSIVFTTKVAATTGATYGSSMNARTTPRPGNGARSTNAAIRPTRIDPTVDATE